MKLLSFVSLATAREIVFPPAIGISSQDVLLSKTPGLPGTINAFAGLTTFANLPYVHCLADAPNSDVEKFDIAFLGAPFDTVRTFHFDFAIQVLLLWALATHRSAMDYSNYESRRSITFTWEMTKLNRILGNDCTTRRSIWTWWHSARLTKNGACICDEHLHW